MERVLCCGAWGGDLALVEEAGGAALVADGDVEGVMLGAEGAEELGAGGGLRGGGALGEELADGVFAAADFLAGGAELAASAVAGGVALRRGVRAVCVCVRVCVCARGWGGFGRSPL
jgi:hypothetical protein